MRFRMVRFQFQGAIKGSNRLIQASQLHQAVAAIMVGIGGLGVQSHSAIKADQGFLIPGRSDERTAKIGMRFGNARIHGQCPANEVYAFVQAPSLSRRDATEMQRVEIARIPFKNSLKSRLGRIHLPLLE